MVSKSTPAPPDPVATINAQSQANLDSATKTAQLNRIDQYTPYGSSTYSVNGTYEDGTPKYTQTTAFSPDQQNLYGLATQGATALGNTAVGMLDQVKNSYVNPIDTSGAPGLASSVSGGPLAYGAGNSGSQQYLGNQYLPSLSNRIDSQGSISGSVNNSGPGLQGALDTSGVPGLASSVTNSGPGLTGGINYQGPGITGQIAGQGDTGSAIQSARDAAYRQQTQYLDPRFDQGQKSLDNSLINQGITQGSEAANNAQGNFARQKQAAYQSAQDSAVAAGNALQGQLYNQGLSSAQLQNSANAQGYGQASNNASFQNAANAQGYQQGLASGQFQNAANAQGTSNALAAGNFQNAANAQGYGQGLSSANLGNAAQAQSYGQGAQNTALYNTNANQGLTNALALNQSNNAAQSTQFGQGLSNANLYNQAQGQQFNQGVTGANLQNQAQAQYLQQLFALRNQPLNEFSALSSGSQVTSPTFTSTPQANVATTDAAGIYNQNYQNQIAQANTQNQGINNLFSLAGTLGGAAIASDRRLKRDITRVGTTPGGIPTYTFRYNNDDNQVYLGVMADEVRHIPGAVLRAPDGFDRVNYGVIK